MKCKNFRFPRRWSLFRVLFSGCLQLFFSNGNFYTAIRISNNSGFFANAGCFKTKVDDLSRILLELSYKIYIATGLVLKTDPTFVRNLPRFSIVYDFGNIDDPEPNIRLSYFILVPHFNF